MKNNILLASILKQNIRNNFLQNIRNNFLILDNILFFNMYCSELVIVTNINEILVKHAVAKICF